MSDDDEMDDDEMDDEDESYNMLDDNDVHLDPTKFLNIMRQTLGNLLKIQMTLKYLN